MRAVRGVSYTVRPGETLAIVGESGSGKSVSSLAVMGLLPSNAAVTGSIRFKGTELLGLSDRKLSRLRGSGISMVFQDPLSALTPVYTIGDQIAEAVRIHQHVSKDKAHERAVELLDLVGIPNPRLRSSSFPHEFSGGMRQRAMIAMAIANDPDLIIADEPTTALDVTIQAQVLDVLAKAQGGHQRGHRADHPRPRGGGRLRRPGDGDVRRQGGRDWPASTTSSTPRGCPTRWACWAPSRGWTWRRRSR